MLLTEGTKLFDFECIKTVASILGYNCLPLECLCYSLDNVMS